MGVAIVFKGIKPQRLRVNKIRLTLLGELRKEGTVHKKELRKTVQTWKGDKPKFESLVSLAKGNATVVTGPTGSDKATNKWMWLDEGTRPHVITARLKPTLAFQTEGFRAKTTPGKFQSRGGSKAGGAWAFPKSVRHPGTKARGWSEKLSKQRKRPFRQRMIKAMNRASEKAF